MWYFSSGEYTAQVSERQMARQSVVTWSVASFFQLHRNCRSFPVSVPVPPVRALRLLLQHWHGGGPESIIVDVTPH